MFVRWRQVFCDVFKHLGTEIVFKPRGAEPVPVLALVKEPEGVYEVGGSQVVGQTAEFTVKASDLTPKTGDFLGVGSKTYRIYEEPLLDASNIVWKFQAVLTEK
jgi:hypothetical protein